MPLGLDKKAVISTLALAGMLKIGMSIKSVSEIDTTNTDNNHFPKPSFVHKAKTEEEIVKRIVQADPSPVEILEEDFERTADLRKPTKKVKKHQKRKIETPKIYLVLPRS